MKILMTRLIEFSKEVEVSYEMGSSGLVIKSGYREDVISYVEILEGFIENCPDAEIRFKAILDRERKEKSGEVDPG